jgi:hypothetical protein
MLPIYKKILEWEKLKKQVSELVEQEREMRKEIISECFPTLDEGTNKYHLGGKFNLVADQPIDRNIDEATWLAFQDKMRKLKIAEDIAKWKPKLNVALYRKLTDKQRILVDNCLIIKPGSVSLKVVEGKK